MNSNIEFAFCEEIKLFGEQEKIATSKSLLLFGGLTIAVWVAVSTSVFWVIYPAYGWFFLIFSAFSILIAMRLQMYSSCHYCVSCTKGFSKLSKLFLGGNNIPGISRGSTMGMTAFIYLLLSIIPGLMLVLSIFQELNPLKLMLLICLLSISIFNAVIRGKK